MWGLEAAILALRKLISSNNSIIFESTRSSDIVNKVGMIISYGVTLTTNVSVFVTGGPTAVPFERGVTVACIGI